MAAGRGLRMGGDPPKQFTTLGGIPILAWSVRAFAAHPEVDEVVVVVPADVARRPPDWLTGAGVRVTAGGGTRAESVRLGTAAIGDAGGIALVHDGVRPFASAALISRVIEAASRGPALPVIAVTDTVKRVDEAGWVIETPPRAALRRAQTPQGFPLELLVRAHAAQPPSTELTDDALACETLGIRVRAVEGEERNIKITTPRDVAVARWMIESGLIVAPT